MTIYNKILLVEDDLILGESIVELLEDESFSVSLATDGKEALNFTYEENFDLYLFDVDIPYINGFELLKELRNADDFTPCIFLTAKNDIESLSTGFDVGADDYIKKPFDSDELLIRIKTQIKKSFKSHHEILTYNDINFDTINQTIFKNKKEVHLTPTQMVLLKLFFKNIGKTISKEELLYHLNQTSESSENSLRVQITHLKKLGLNITNQRAIGYRLEKA